MQIENQSTFKVFDVLAEAWEKTKGFKAPFWGALFIALLIVIAFVLVTSIPIVILGALQADKSIITTANTAQVFVQQFITAPLIAGLYIMAIKRSIDKPVRWKMVFSQFKYFIKYGFAYIARILIIIVAVAIPTLIGTAIVAFMPYAMIGKLIYALFSLIAVFAALYLIVAYAAMMPLIADRGLGIWQALETSRRTITKHWFKTLGLVILLGLIICTSFFTLGILLIWTLPMTYAAWGVFYRELFGVATTD